MGKLNIDEDWWSLFNKRFTLKVAGEPEDRHDENSEKLVYSVIPFPVDDIGNENNIGNEKSFDFISNETSVRDIAIHRASLDKARAALSDVKLKEWKSHTKMVNMCQNIPKELSNLINAELSTHAWAKLCTILKDYEIIIQLLDVLDGERIASVHLCEGPGAFVCCFNHLMKTEYPGIEWLWLANSLNPYHEGNTVSEMIADTVLIDETFEQWCFGDDFSGNITTIENIKAISETSLSKLGSVNLITADGSIDCSQSPSDQETHVTQLIISEILVALQTLDRNGIFIFKIFTMFELVTAAILFMLSCCFDSVDLSKPGPSKPSNSEVYVVCCGYIGNDTKTTHAIVKTLFTWYHDPSIASFANLPVPFMSQVSGAVKYFTERQITSINSNLSSFQNIDSKGLHFLRKRQRMLTRKFINSFDLQCLSSDDYVAPILSSKFQSRHLGWNYQSPLSQSDSDITTSHRVKTLHVTPSSWDVYTSFSSCFVIHIGKGVSKVCSSRFYPSLFLDSVEQQLDIFRGPIKIDHVYPKNIGSDEVKGSLAHDREWDSIMSIAKCTNNSSSVSMVLSDRHCRCDSLTIQFNRNSASNETLTNHDIILNLERLYSSADITEKLDKEKEKELLLINTFRISKYCCSSCSKYCSRLHRKHWFVTQLIIALTHLPSGGTLICEVGCLIECFYAGLIYLISHSFDSLAGMSVPITSQAQVNIGYIAMMSFRQSNVDDVISHLRNIECSLMTSIVESEEHEALNIVHPRYLSNPEFSAFLHSFNRIVFNGYQ